MDKPHRRPFPGLGRRLSALATTAAAAAALLLATVTTEAVAATTYTPTGGPTTNFVASVKRGGAPAPGPGLYVELIEPGQSIFCSGFSLGGPVRSPGTSRAYYAETATLSAFSATGCTNPLMGATTITALTTPVLRILGDPTSGIWPARITNVQWKVFWANCVFYISGFINGKFDPATQVFTPAGNPRPTTGPVPVGLTIVDTPAPPTGSMCVTVDLQAEDSVGLTGTFANVPPAGSTGLAIANP